ncbi:MAG: Gfo/Idh/MocA family oxidoreductase [Caldilineaceae bacterium]|nr:Gfo/Idh/MocA family oxidoreductase [Caldilineaceae bacterium]
MQQTIRVGIVGCGGIAQGQHIPGYLRTANVEIAALCDVNEALLHTVGEQHSITRLLTDYRALVTLPDLDAVDICTAPDSHYPIALAALKAGKHLFCEKPLALTYPQAKELYEVAQTAGVVTGIGFVHRVTPAARLAHQLVSSGALGEIYNVMAIFSAGGANYAAQPMRWRNQRAVAGAGALFDLGSHMVDMVRWWLGQEIISVCAQTQIFVPQRKWPNGALATVDTDDASTMLASFEQGTMATFINSFVATGRGFDQRIELYGSNGALIYDQATPYELAVCIGEEMLKLSAAAGFESRKKDPYPTMPVPEKLRDRWWTGGGSTRSLTPDFVAAIRGEDAFLPTFYEGMKVQEVLDAALRSVAEARWVPLS